MKKYSKPTTEVFKMAQHLLDSASFDPKNDGGSGTMGAKKQTFDDEDDMDDGSGSIVIRDLWD